ncbi:probable plastid-lipid-associated protein 9 chloroplastic [Phtheirospermum japonicum]|uniref:Probable plastid-lipid-associated protein 9 chloroplastic n=1 Tax=Phtheirospermum japonicum TaxID=374723 RepID=A0A830C462_9LAMI|nr:probable plastid-lipid-associated protein 9 chloroplastic [Phtheirospermum japonicum]
MKGYFAADPMRCADCESGGGLQSKQAAVRPIPICAVCSEMRGHCDGCVLTNLFPMADVWKYIVISKVYTDENLLALLRPGLTLETLRFHVRDNLESALRELQRPISRPSRQQLIAQMYDRGEPDHVFDQIRGVNLVAQALIDLDAHPVEIEHEAPDEAQALDEAQGQAPDKAQGQAPDEAQASEEAQAQASEEARNPLQESKNALIHMIGEVGGFTNLVAGNITDQQKLHVNELIVKVERLNPSDRPAEYMSELLRNTWTTKWFGGRCAANFLLESFPHSICKLLRLDVVIYGTHESVSAIMGFPNRINGKLALSTNFSAVGASIAKEEFVDCEFKFVSSIDQLTQDVAYVKQIPEPFRDAIVLGVKVPMVETFARSFVITFLDNDMMIRRDSSGVAEVLKMQNVYKRRGCKGARSTVGPEAPTNN